VDAIRSLSAGRRRIVASRHDRARRLPIQPAKDRVFLGVGFGRAALFVVSSSPRTVSPARLGTHNMDMTASLLVAAIVVPWPAGCQASWCKGQGSVCLVTFLLAFSARSSRPRCSRALGCTVAVAFLPPSSQQFWAQLFFF
jgi:hypothetical protein